MMVPTPDAFGGRRIILSREDWLRINDRLEKKKYGEREGEHGRGSEKKGKSEELQRRVGSEEEPRIWAAVFGRRNRCFHSGSPFTSVGPGSLTSGIPTRVFERVNDAEQKAKDRLILQEAVRLSYEERQAARNLLSGASLAAVLYERKNQLDFGRKLKARMKRKRDKEAEMNEEKIRQINEENVKTKRREWEGKQVLKRDLESQIMEVRAKTEFRELEKAIERSVFERMNENAEKQSVREEERKREEKAERRVDVKADLMRMRNKRANEKRTEEEEERVRLLHRRVGERLAKARKAAEDARGGRDGAAKRMEAEARRTGENEKDATEDYFTGVGPGKWWWRRVRPRGRREGVGSNRTTQKVSDGGVGKVGAGGGEKKEENARDVQSRETSRERGPRDCFGQKEPPNSGRKLEQKERGVGEVREKNGERAYSMMAVEVDPCDHALRYCDYVLGEARRHRRPLYPVLAAIRGVKRELGIADEKKKLQHLASHL